MIDEEESRKRHIQDVIRWQKNNPEKVKQYTKTYSQKPEIIARAKKKRDNISDEQLNKRREKQRQQYSNKKQEREKQKQNYEIIKIGKDSSDK